MGKYIDLTGKTFNRLTVISVAGKTDSGNYKWECRCDCGVVKIVSSDHLTRKKQSVQSCGCYRDDQIRKKCSPDPNETAFRLLIGVYKKRARKKGIEFSLSDKEFKDITSSDCVYCGEVPAMTIENKPKTGLYCYNSIDRDDHKKGYSSDNSIPCCKICNYMKWTLTKDEFLLQVKRIAEKTGL